MAGVDGGHEYEQIFEMIIGDLFSKMNKRHQVSDTTAHHKQYKSENNPKSYNQQKYLSEKVKEK